MHLVIRLFQDVLIKKIKITHFFQLAELLFREIKKTLRLLYKV